MLELPFDGILLPVLDKVGARLLEPKRHANPHAQGAEGQNPLQLARTGLQSRFASYDYLLYPGTDAACSTVSRRFQWRWWA